MKRHQVLGIQWALAAVFTAGVLGCAHGVRPTALDTYVQTPDPHYSYKLEKTLPGEGYTAYVLSMTSQAWRSEKEVDRPIWSHWLTIIKPAQVSTNKALLLIGGGKNTNPAPDKVDKTLTTIAVATQSVVAELSTVPSEPLTFPDDTQPRTEDGIIAYTWDKYLHTGDVTWLARLPMTKSAVRAMDTVTAFSAGPEMGKVAVDQFVVAGGSKRGWTTWTTAAVDKRVIGIVPIVIDMLNLEKSFDHHWRVYGRFAEAVGDYSARNLMDWAGTPEYRSMLKIVEPYEYRSRLTMPKLLMNATGDQFFVPDSSQFYFKDLPGEKHLRYVPNADHGLGGSDAPETLLAFYSEIVSNTPRPRFSWTMPKDGSIRVKAIDAPVEVKVWQATNPDARDFRLQTIGKAWTSENLADQGGGVYVGRVNAPAKGWTAFLVELTYKIPGPAPLKMTTSVRVVPDVLPFPSRKVEKVPVGFIRGKHALHN